jgi:hypothetical protein
MKIYMPPYAFDVADTFNLENLLFKISYLSHKEKLEILI